MHTRPGLLSHRFIVLTVRAARGLLGPALLAVACGGVAAEERRGAPEPVMTEEVRVTATRLAHEPESIDQVPAHVTVIDRERIEDSKARTLQDLLAFESGVVLYDEVGNDIEKTFDLRGFAQGSGTRVYLDGAPLNDTRNNGVALELVPVEALERIEITRGSAAALAGGGSEAGVIHLSTRRGEGFGGALSLAGGSFDASSPAGRIHGGSGRFDFFLSGSRDETDGFRENAGGAIRRLAGSAGVDLGGERRLELAVLDARSDLGNPGALTSDELAEDPTVAPFNRLDFSEQRLRQGSLNFRGPLAGRLSMSANLFVRDRGSDVLSTGRSAELFGGFYLESDASAVGSTVQLAHDLRSGRIENRLTFGVEWQDGETDSVGFFTPAEDPGQIDPASPASANTTERRTLSLYVQNRLSPAPAWSFLAGLRADRDRVEYRDGLDPAIRDSRRFSEVSLRAGVNWKASERYGLYASYGEAFLPPTAEELFAFPLFGSNATLRPEDSRSYELGLRGRYARGLHLDVSAFLLDTRDEIVFVPDMRLDPFTGSNQNVGKTRRRGIEASLRGRQGRRLSAFAQLTLLDAEFRNGPNRGNEVPLVPGERAAVGIRVALPAAVEFRTDAVYVGSQVLDNDGENAQAALDAYTVVNARLSWESAAAERPKGGPSLFAEVRNLFDREYATRGIYAGEVFLTPAPGRRVLAGAGWVF